MTLRQGQKTFSGHNPNLAICRLLFWSAVFSVYGQEYDEFGAGIPLNDEKICVGFRKGSDLTSEADAFIQAVYEDGSIETLAEKYGIGNAVLN